MKARWVYKEKIPYLEVFKIDKKRVSVNSIQRRVKHFKPPKSYALVALSKKISKRSSLKFLNRSDVVCLLRLIPQLHLLYE